MRIAIDATPMLLRSSGVKNYVYYWIRSLQQFAGTDSISPFPFLGPLGELNHAASTMTAWQTCIRLGYAIASNFVPFPILNPAARGCDIFHMSSILVRRPPTNTRRTATLHDMTCWIMPEFHTSANVRAARDFGERVTRHADGLIAVSEWTRRDAIRWLDLAPERIEVIYSGVADAFFQTDAVAVARARAKYSLARPYVLCVGTIEPRKNLHRLLDAWSAIPPSLTGDFELVLAGPEGWNNAGVVARARSMDVRYIDYVPEADLPAVTAGATAFAYPSLYEGFGFPVVQAMACAVPVLTSNVSALPEITGDAGVLIDPLSVAEITAGLQKLLSSESLREKLGRAGRQRAERFRWEQCARQSWAFFERVAGHN
jgi:glycosyltransferase involved in cell wall biosynthesis